MSKRRRIVPKAQERRPEIMQYYPLLVRTDG